jgi:hypothetical protein
MRASVVRKLLVDGCDGPSGWLKTRVKSFCQREQSLSQQKSFLKGRLPVRQLDALRCRPSRQCRWIRQQVGYGLGTSAGGIDKVEPHGIAQQSEFSLEHQRHASATSTVFRPPRFALYKALSAAARTLLTVVP